MRDQGEAAYRMLVECEPENISALEGLAALLRSTARIEEAGEMLARAHRIELLRMGVPAAALDEVIEFRLAADGYRPMPSAAPAAYVTALFDEYADSFDTHLAGMLKYRAPEALFAGVEPYLPAGGRLAVLDLGCGTGLSGVPFRRFAARLVGIDLSAGMVDKARERDIYDELIVGDLNAALAGQGEFDLIVAVDVLNYLGDLSGASHRVTAALRTGGLLAFTAEATEQPGFALSAHRRYRHHVDYLRGTLTAAGLTEVACGVECLRYEGGRPVAGHVMVWRREERA